MQAAWLSSTRYAIQGGISFVITCFTELAQPPHMLIFKPEEAICARSLQATLFIANRHGSAAPP